VARIRYRDAFVSRLSDDIADLVANDRGDAAAIEARLLELGRTNSSAVADYARRMPSGLGIPDSAFKVQPPYYFPDEPPVRTFRTSGTTGQARGAACYSARGLQLMEASILRQARSQIMRGLESAVFLRVVPPESHAPEMVMAYGMERIAHAFGHPELSACVIDSRGVDYELLAQRLTIVQREGLPVVLIGGSLAFVNVCTELEARKARWSLPRGSRIVDAGGFKGRDRGRGIDVPGLRALLSRTFGVSPEACLNLFGMTELASQLYDAADAAVGPLGERPKGSTAFVWPQVRDAQELQLREHGSGLLEVVDLCILDRPHRILTGDRGIASQHGVAVTGRIERGQSRGCSLTLDALTGPTEAHG
jgi:hypothetical protein